MLAKEKAAMVIDHDIYFIDIVSDSLLVFDGEGVSKEMPTDPWA